MFKVIKYLVDPLIPEPFLAHPFIHILIFTHCLLSNYSINLLHLIALSL